MMFGFVADSLKLRLELDRGIFDILCLIWWLRARRFKSAEIFGGESSTRDDQVTKPAVCGTFCPANLAAARRRMHELPHPD